MSTDLEVRLLEPASTAEQAQLLAPQLKALADPNRLHLLLLLATVGSYSLVAIGLIALGAHVNRGVLRVLKAIELLRSA